MIDYEFDYDYDGIYSYVPWEDTDFRSMLYLWCNVKPYSDFKASSLNGLLFAFENNKSIIFKKGINTIGFTLWTWMFPEEYGSHQYDNEEIYKRDNGELLVVTDLIVQNDLNIVKNHLLQFAKIVHPNEKRVYYNRPNRKSNLRINQ
jgi:hypothetical protein